MVFQRPNQRSRPIIGVRVGPKQPVGARISSRRPDLPVEVVLYILSQVYVKENEVMHMAPRKWGFQALRSQLAAPFLYAQDCIVDDFWCCFNMLQDTL